MNTRAITAAALAAALTLGLAGCGKDREPATTPGLTNDATVPTENPTWEAGGKAAAVKDAEKILRLYARPDEPWVNWWPDLKPHVEPTARGYWSRSDPSNIPPLGKIIERKTYCDKNPYVIEVAFTTADGTWGIDLGRDRIGGPWQASAFILPGHSSAIQSCGGADRMPANPPVEQDDQ